jgi:subtilisin family serine protease
VFIVLLALLSGVFAVQAQGRPDGIATHIIVFRSNVNARAAAADMASAHGLAVTNIYEHALNGMAAIVPAGRLNALSHDPRVAYVEENMEAHIAAQDIPTGIDRIFATGNTSLDIDSSDDWRVDVDVAVVDTGIDFQHPDLNVMGGVNCAKGGPFNKSCGSGGDDDHYHGTHVAGTIGALDNGIGVVGVAPGARLWAVKVLNSQGSGYTNWIVAGIDWVVAQGNIEVINMSLGGSGTSQAYLDAINNAVANGVVVVVAAGNSSADAGGYSPAFVPDAITVSALADFDGVVGGLGSPTCRADEDDTFANFSNYGSVVDIIAPGVCILSTYPIEQGEYGTISGTSMASPHVAGAAALLASGANAPQDRADVLAIRNTLVNSGNLNWDNSDDPDGIKERLLDVSGFVPALVPGNGGGGGTNNPPTASFSTYCTNLVCDFNGGSSSDTDGTISDYEWNFGDGSTGNGVTVNHTYAADGTYTVTLTVTDDDGATGNSSQNVAVSSGGGSCIPRGNSGKCK